MDIKEIALQLAHRKCTRYNHVPVDHGIRYNFSDAHLIDFAEALIAEIAKQNEPCAFLHEWIEYHPFGDTYAGKRCAAITSDEKPFDSSDTVSPLFTFPPTAEQIANETAEACALQVATETRFHWLDAARVAKEIRSGEWRKHMKGD